MAVPKKKTSKSKKNIRKTAWKRKIVSNAILALSIGRLMDKNPKPKNILLD